ncbi:MAG: hypothetical protein IJ014_04595 [Rikenellaceae bacterium]|nr:hypothetical protein [Rikenellaceae bacterium]
MKKIVMAAMALMVMFSASVVDINAQGRYNNLSPERVAALRSERMARELRLSPAQYAKLYKLNLREARRMNRSGLYFFDCMDYRCDLLRIIGEVNYRIYESMYRDRRELRRDHHHHHAAVPAPAPRPNHGHVGNNHHHGDRPQARPQAPHSKPNGYKPAPPAKPSAKPAPGHPDKGGNKGGHKGGGQGRPQYRVK